MSRVTGFRLIDGQEGDVVPPARPRGLFATLALTAALTGLGGAVFFAAFSLLLGDARKLVLAGGAAVALGCWWLYQTYSPKAERGPPPSLLLRWAALTTLAMVLCACALWFLSGFGMGGLGQPKMWPPVYLALCLPVAIYMALWDRRGWRAMGLENGAPQGLVWFGVGALVVLGLLAVAALMDRDFALLLARQRTLLILVWIIPFVLVQAGAEEVVFRGWLMPSLGARYGAAFAVIASSLVFAVLHVAPGSNLLGYAADIAPRFLMGVAFAMLALHAGSLWPAIGLHWGWNTLVITGAAAESPDHEAFSFDIGPRVLTGADLIDPLWLASMAAVVIVTAIALWATRRSLGLVLQGKLAG